MLVFLTLLCLLLGALGYFFGLYDVETPKNEDTNETGKIGEVDNELATSLYESIKVYESSLQGNNDIDYYTINGVTNNSKLRIGVKNLDVDSKSTNEISVDTLENSIKKVFGPNSSITHQNFTYDCDEYTYNENKKVYTIKASDCKSVSTSYFYSKFDKAYTEDENIIIEEKVLYEEGTQNNENYSMTIYIYTLNKGKQLGMETGNSYEVNFDSYKKEASVVKYLFIKNSDGNYYFSSVIK